MPFVILIGQIIDYNDVFYFSYMQKLKIIVSEIFQWSF